ncbi:MAG TPA: adenylate/guanylate cyclase domain-containing protein [Burkholderiales bacterium]
MNPKRAVLFVDIVDSTGIYETLGDEQALAVINLLFGAFTTKVAAASGIVIKTLGDGMVCQFASADSAFRAACAMQTTTNQIAPRVPGQLAVKVAFNFGPVVLKGGDVFGDTVNVCARLVAMANPGQVLSTAQAVNSLSRTLMLRCRALYPVKIRGRGEPVSVYDVPWRVDPDLTETTLHVEAPGRAGRWVLKLSYAGETFDVQPEAEARVGRDRSNDVVVDSPRASRVHARIYARERNFVIVDQSSNGTFVLIDGADTEVMLRREEALLGERGWIGLGYPASKHGNHVLRYRVAKRKA